MLKRMMQVVMQTVGRPMKEPRLYHEAIPYSQRARGEKTADIPDGEVRHLTCFDQELVRGLVELGTGFSGGRALARGPDGALYLVTESAAGGLLLSGAASPAPRAECFAEPVVLVGIAEDGLLGRTAGVPGGAGLAIAGDGETALVWHDDAGVWLAQGRAGGGQVRWDGPPRLIAEGARANDLCFDPAGALHLLYDSPDGLIYAACTDTCRTEPIADTGCEAVLAVAGNGDIHAAWQRVETLPWQVGDAAGEYIEESIRYRCYTGGAWGPEEQVTWPITLHPALALVGNEPLIVFQTEGIRRVEPRTMNYLDQREGGGSGVGFAVREGGRWRIGVAAKPEEIIVADHRGSDVFAGRIYPMVEEMHRPRLGVDRHGVPWTVWANTTRRHTYAARWLGKAFSAPFEVRGGWYALSPFTTVAGENGSDHLDIAAIAADRVYYTPAVVPGLSAASSEQVLFLDLREVAEMNGVEQSLGRLERYPGNPVFTPAPPVAWDDRLVAWPSVWRDGDRYLMQYQGKGTLLPNANVIMGLAESRDGIHWTRPNLNVVPLAGQPENNCIPWIVFFRDDEEPDLQKRYQGARTNGLWTVDLQRTLMYSPDAVHWMEAGEMANIHCLHEANGPSFRDPYDVPERRFKAIGRTCGDEGRSAGMMWSADGVHWEGYEAFLDVDNPYGRPAGTWRGRYNAHRFLHGGGERRGQGQIYWNTVWIEHGLYLCLYAPMHWDGGYDVSLTVSRDGYAWTRVCGGQPLLEREPVGMRESGAIFVGYGNARPVRFGDRLRVYYGAGVRHHGTEPHATYTGNGIGFADIRPDGWACLRLQRDREEGFITSIPVDVPAGRYGLRLNAEGAGDSALTVEALDARTGHVLPGCGAGRLSGTDDSALRVEWPGGPLSGPALVRLRFTLRSPRVRLYAFRFEPAP